MSCVALSAALVLVSGCSDSKQSPNAEVAPAQSPLEIPIFDCQAKHVTCSSSKQSPSDASACQKELEQCLVDAGPKLMELAETVLACKDKAVECLDNGGEQTACRDEFIACVGIDLPPLPGDGDAGFPLPPRPPWAQSDAGPGHPPVPPSPPSPPSGPQPPAAGAPAPPGVPPFPQPGAPGHPGQGGPQGVPPGLPGWSDAGIPVPGDIPGAVCIENLFACLSAGTDPMECANEARECVQKEVPNAPDWAAGGPQGPKPGRPGPQPGDNRGGP